MENVKGFDQDEARTTFIEMLKNQGYHYQVFSDFVVNVYNFRE